MQTQHLPAPLSWPQLPDEAAVTVDACLNEFLMQFESHYLGQIERYSPNSALADWTKSSPRNTLRSTPQ